MKFVACELDILVAAIRAILDKEGHSDEGSTVVGVGNSYPSASKLSASVCHVHKLFRVPASECPSQLHEVKVRYMVQLHVDRSVTRACALRSFFPSLTRQFRRIVPHFAAVIEGWQQVPLDKSHSRLRRVRGLTHFLRRHHDHATLVCGYVP